MSNKPERAKSAFEFFRKYEMNTIKAALPEGSGIGDIGRAVSEAWKGIDDGNKAKYDQMAQVKNENATRCITLSLRCLRISILYFCVMPHL